MHCHSFLYQWSNWMYRCIAVCNYLVLFRQSVELFVIMQICHGKIFVLEDMVLVLRIRKDTL